MLCSYQHTNDHVSARYPAEELGYHLGLTVHTDSGALFYNARVSDTPPSTAGYGTQISTPGFEPNTVFPKLGIPLQFSQTKASQITSEQDLLDRLREIEANSTDALLCFNHGVIRGEYTPHTGHVTVFDRIVNDQIRIIDASPRHPKWRLVDPAIMLEAITRHGDENAGGIWHFTHQP